MRRGCTARRTCRGSRSSSQIAGSGGPFGKEKFETGGQKPPRHHATALQDEFRFGSHQPGADFDHPSRSGQANADAPRVAESLHEIAIRKRVGRSDVDYAAEFFARNQQIDRAYEVGFVNPGDILGARPLRAAKSASDQA